MKAKKTLITVLVIVAVAMVALVGVRNVMLKKAALRLIEEQTGLRMEIDAFDVGVFKPTFEIRGLTLLNPPDFPEGEAFEIERFYVHYDLLSLFSDEVHFYEVEMRVPKIVVVQLENGETNMGRMTEQTDQQMRKRKRSGEEPAPRGEPEDDQPPPERAPESRKEPKDFRIDTLTLALGEAEYRQYVEGRTEPKIDRIELNQEQTFHDVTDPYQVANAVTMNMLQMRLSSEMQKLSEEHKEELDELGVTEDDLNKAQDVIKGFFKGL